MALAGLTMVKVRIKINKTPINEKDFLVICIIMVLMLKLVKYQQRFLGILAAIALFLIGLAVLGISLWSANQDAVGIKVIF